MKKRGFRVSGRSAGLLVSLLIVAQTVFAANKTGRVVVDYWEKWTGFEGDAMKAIVEKFNRSQDQIQVRYLTISQLEQKLLLATAGGNPPDVAGMMDSMVTVYALKGALIPLDSYMKRDGVVLQDYVPEVASFCQEKGFTWALPVVPSCLALYYNKKLFREAGLDPERPPRTITELDEYAGKLTKIDSAGKITQLGFSPGDPGWWNPAWPAWFGSQMWDGEKRFMADTTASLAAFKWVRTYPERFGNDRMQSFRDSAGQFASAQNSFIAGKIAMQLQGVFMFNFIEKYNPQLEWGAAPFPTASESLTSVTLVDGNLLSIPKGARHPDEAWQFIRFVQKPENLEDLNLRMKRFSPLRKTTPEFYAKHPNPRIKLFHDLASSPNACIWPKTVVLNEYLDEMNTAFDEIWLGRKTPAEALEYAMGRIQPKLDKANRQWERVRKSRLEDWSNQ